MKPWLKHLMPNAGSLLLIVLLLLVQSVIAGPPSQQGPQPAVSVQPIAPEAINSPSSLLFSYQGQLLDVAGNPILNARLPMTFNLYTVATDGASFWTEIHAGAQAITVTNGLFNVLLGSLTPLDPTQLTGDVYLELTVNGERLSPRELLTSVAYAVEATTLAAGATTRGALTVPSNLTVNGKTHLNGNAAVLAGSDPWGEGLNIDSPPDIWGGIKWRRTNRVGNAGNWHLGFDSTSDQKLHFIGENSQYVMTLQQNGNVGIGTTSPGARARLSVVGGALSISQSPIPADATLHIQGALGLDNRLLQMSPVGVSQPAVALVGSTDAAGNGQWWEWGVTPANNFRIAPGFSLDGNTGLAIAANGDTTIGGTLHVAGTDVIMDEFGGRGGGRAMVNDNNDTLTINYANDFAGGVRINGPVACGALVESNLQTTQEQDAGGTERFTEGDVLCWGIDQLELCTTANDRLVQAVADASGKPIVLGAEKVKVLGPVQRGDILVASDVPGYAMVNNDPRSGSVIAQALESFDGKRGVIKAMIRKW